MDVPYRALAELAVHMAERSAFEERSPISALLVPTRGIAGAMAGRVKDRRWVGRARKAP